MIVLGIVWHMRDTGMSLNMTRAGVTRDEEWEGLRWQIWYDSNSGRCDTWISICCEWQGCPPPACWPGPHSANIPAPGSCPAIAADHFARFMSHALITLQNHINNWSVAGKIVTETCCSVTTTTRGSRTTRTQTQRRTSRLRMVTDSAHSQKFVL